MSSNTINLVNDSDKDDDKDLDVEGLAPLQQKTKAQLELSKNFLKFMPPLIREIDHKGVTLSLDGMSGAILLHGFYKNGPMKLVIQNEDIVAIDKRGREKVIKTYQDLVKLNYMWWRLTNTKSQYVVPKRPFAEDFLSNGWVKRQIIFVPIDGEGLDIGDDKDDLKDDLLET